MAGRAEHKVVYAPQASGETRIRGSIADQAALHGILNRAFDLGFRCRPYNA
jgi:hypothetical protein